MTLNLLTLFCLLAADAELAAAPGVQLSYRGTVAQVRRDRAEQAAEKSFDLNWLLTRVDDDGGVGYVWVVEERGAGGFGWADGCGRWGQNAEGIATGPAGPALLFDFGTGKHVIPVGPPRFILPESPAAGLKWTRDDLEHEITRTTIVDERRAWEIRVSNQFGTLRTVWVEPESQVIVRSESRVFMNQGTEYRLAVQLAAVAEPDAATRKALADGVTALVNLRGKLKRPPRTIAEELTPAQLLILQNELPAVKQKAGKGATARIVTAAERDLARQSERTSALDRLIAAQTGRAVEPFEARGAGDVKLSSDDLRDRVTVLHFWEYRDEPLTEPYGQVGYLEFLYGKRKSQGLQVVGIAVDGRFQQPTTAGAAASGVRKLKNFMNLTYPVVFDGGDLLKQFGDPRTDGGELPLFVVVGKDGRTAHYKVGHYDVDRQAGLKQLDDVVKGLLAADE
jgi:hypothetical protein